MVDTHFSYQLYFLSMFSFFVLSMLSFNLDDLSPQNDSLRSLFLMIHSRKALTVLKKKELR